MKPVVTANEYRRVNRACTRESHHRQRIGPAIAWPLRPRGEALGTKAASPFSPAPVTTAGMARAPSATERPTVRSDRPLVPDPKTMEAEYAASKAALARVLVAPLDVLADVDVVIDADTFSVRPLC